MNQKEWKLAERYLMPSGGFEERRIQIWAQFRPMANHFAKTKKIPENWENEVQRFSHNENLNQSLNKRPRNRAQKHDLASKSTKKMIQPVVFLWEKWKQVLCSQGFIQCAMCACLPVRYAWICVTKYIAHDEKRKKNVEEQTETESMDDKTYITITSCVTWMRRVFMPGCEASSRKMHCESKSRENKEKRWIDDGKWTMLMVVDDCDDDIRVVCVLVLCMHACIEKTERKGNFFFFLSLISLLFVKSKQLRRNEMEKTFSFKTLLLRNCPLYFHFRFRFFLLRFFALFCCLSSTISFLLRFVLLHHTLEE